MRRNAVFDTDHGIGVGSGVGVGVGHTGPGRRPAFGGELLVFRGSLVILRGFGG
ncbi:hypothetical protein [Pseudofrankia asymbiotica]|uniref:hypothetical protein n=1 Tax=Pseudofrankia asymbiotica TaxID=1834516 RepID=UPI0013040272|nr:hypothetical protein [Pseudofrankia asymbiotica]